MTSHVFKSSDEPLTKKLRHATTESHAAIESRLDLFRPGLTTARYAELLQRWFAFHETWEPLAEKWFSSDGDFFPRRSKIDLLKRDLAACNASSADITCKLGEITPANRETALGTLYVVEGSTLGGQIIAPTICNLLGLTPERGVTFYSSYGNHTAEMWRATKELIDRSPAISHPNVIRAATATFDWLGDWLLESVSLDG